MVNKIVLDKAQASTIHELHKLHRPYPRITLIAHKLSTNYTNYPELVHELHE